MFLNYDSLAPQFQCLCMFVVKDRCVNSLFLFYLQPLQKDTEIIKNFSDPLVIGAACAAVNQITIKSVFTSKSVLVTITNGTRQVCNYILDNLGGILVSYIVVHT